MELCAAVKAARVENEKKQEIGLGIRHTSYYTNSMIVLELIKNAVKQFMILKYLY